MIRNKKERGITLIALVVTIIVLIILAGISINLLFGNFGVVTKAKEAKNKMEAAQYEEELKMCVLELQADEATNGTEFSMETIRKKLVEKVKKVENTTDIEFPTKESATKVEGTYKGYEFYIDEKYVVHVGDKATGISLTTSFEPAGWTKGPLTATITIKSNNGIKKVEPNEGSKNGNNEYIISKTNITENTSFEYKVTDEQGNTQNKTVVINTIDKTAPADFTITAEKTEEGIKITGTTTDAESGIDKYEYYVKKSTDSDYTMYESNIITGLTSGTYSVYAIAYDKAENKKQSKPVEVKTLVSYSDITATMVAQHPEIYYGLKVTNYTSQNGQNDWRIFYSDGDHIFLITGDYINTEETNRISTSTGMTTSKYSAYWEYNKAPAFQTVNSATLTRFKATEYKLQSGINNSKCVSTLLNDNNWSSYKDSENKAEKAIGSPTVEMWMDSWNARYKNSSDQLYRKASTSTSNPGYYVGTSPDPTTNTISSDTMRVKEGYNNKLYYPHTESNGYNGTLGYWLASPSANYNNNVLGVWFNGIVNHYHYGNSNLGVRPVVSLNSGITVNAEEAE